MKTLNFLNTFDYKYLIAGVIVAILYSIWSFGIKPGIQKKKVKEVLTEICKDRNYKVEATKSKIIDFILVGNLETKYRKINIRIISVPTYNTITINSKNTWNMHFGGSGRQLYHNRFLEELRPFLDKDYPEDELKLVIVYKDSRKIQKYLNESELEITKVSDLIYDYKVAIFNNLKEDFDKL